MGWQTTTLGSPFVKGLGKAALGIAICGIVYNLDSVNVITHDSTGTFIKYAAYTGGVITALGGISKIVNGQ